MYSSTIVITHDVDALDKLFASEDNDLGRSSFKITKETDKLTINIMAEDAVALKTVMNTIAKILIVWEKTKALK